jgi:hypothetical protein
MGGYDGFVSVKNCGRGNDTGAHDCEQGLG